jgi:hypothetical protein
MENNLEERPAMNTLFVSPSPGVDDDLLQRYHKWAMEVWVPLVMKVPGITGADRYRIVKENPDYPSFGIITHWENIRAYINTRATPEILSLRGEFSSWSKRAVVEYIWNASYNLVKSFRSGASYSSDEDDTRIGNTTVMHFEAFRLTATEQDKYLKWLNEYGFSFFIPFS